MVRPGCDESRQVPVAEVRPEGWVKRAPDPPKDDTVTLTKSQFHQILQVIGQVNVNGNEKVFQENQDFHSSKDSPENGAHHREKTQEANQKEIFDNVPKSTVENSNKLNVPCPLDVVISCPASLSWSAPQTELSPTKLSPLSKVEQKRLQWQKEKAEMIDWNPWGKPGAGAPPKKTQIVAPITPRTNNQLLMVHTSGAMPYTNTVSTGVSSCIASPSHCRIMSSNVEQQHFLPSKNFTNYTCVSQPVKPVPPMFKSSIAFGNADSDSVSSDYYKRQQWLSELEFQREEHRRIQEQLQMVQMPDSSAWGNNCKDEVESISTSVDGSILPGAVDYHKRNYVRGQGFQLDPVDAALAEERRQKAQEYQQAIREQMEEKQKRLQAEQERKRLEEEAEERRLEAERARIQAEYEQEQLRLKQKAELEEKKHQALLIAVQQAEAQAEMEKKTKKIQKLIPQSENESNQSPVRNSEDRNNVSTLSSQIEQNLTIEKSEGSQTNIRKSVTYSDDSSFQSEPGDKQEMGIQTVPVSDLDKQSTYVVDRVLTPSIFRVRAKTGGQGREFGTQTDIHYGKYTNEDAESTESNTSSFHNPIGKRIVRVQHSKPYKAQRRGQCSEMLSNERPKWGVNQPSKSYVRMTERDPHFTKRKKMQELRKQHWARELASQKSTQSSRRTIVTSYPTLRVRKAASSSDCTLGYSSSEFETRSCHHLRSNSTPRYQQPSGFRSDCGSAETIAYFNYSPSAHCSRVSKSLLHARDSQSSDNLPSIIGGSEPSPTHRLERFHSLSYSNGSLPPMRRKWHSQETFYPANSFHNFSPPHVPGVYPRVLADSFRYELPPPHVPQRRKWSDQESFDLESVVRSRVTEESRGSSAESSEKSQSASASSAGSSREKSASASASTSSQNPLVCPEVVTGRPTPRQDRILQNLSSLRQGLLKKQRELESLIRRPPPYFS